MQVEPRQGLAAREDLIDAVQALHEPDQLEWNLKHHRQSPVPGQRRVSAELDGVAEALFGVDQQGPSRAGFATPLRLTEIPPRRKPAAGVPAPFIFGPAFRKVAPRQERHPQVRMSHRVGRVGADGGPKTVDGVVQPALAFQHGRQVIVRHRESGPQGDRLAKPVGRIAWPAQRGQRAAQVVVGLRRARIEGERLSQHRRRFSPSPLRPQHVAEIGMKRRLFRLQRDGFPDQSLSHIGLADLMRQDPHQMPAVGVLGVGGEHVAIMGLGLAQTTGLMQPHRLAERRRQRQRQRPRLGGPGLRAAFLAVHGLGGSRFWRARPITDRRFILRRP